MMTREIYSDLPIPPGEFLEEVLEDVESSFELRQIIKEGGDINVPNSE